MRASKIFCMNIKDLTAGTMNRRDFLKLTLGAALFSMLPTSVEATTLTEFKMKGKKPTINNDFKITPEDEAIIGEETIGIENIVIRETNLNFSKRLERRPRTDAIVIHHIGNTNKNVNAAAVHRWHRQNGWSGAGYHYFIRKDGTIERGRPLDAVGAHTYEHNDHTVGICVVGNFELARPTPEQFRAVERLVGALGRIYNITPRAKTVLGHQDFCKTTCPGIYLYKRLPDIIRNAV